MRVCIVGCGAIGSIYGAHLAMHDGFEVWAYDTDANHVDAINQNGLALKGEEQCRVHIRATCSPCDIPTCELGIVATKIYQTRPAIEATAHLFQEGVVCCLQNGIGNEEIIAEYVDQIISGTTLAGGHISAPGVVTFDTRESTWIGPVDDRVSMERVEALAALLTEKGLKTQAIDDPKGMKWSKLIFNAAANPVCALTGLNFGDMYNQSGLRDLMYGLANEGIEVSKGLEIELHSNPVQLLDKAAESATSHIPSMLSDVLHKKNTEIEALNGGIVRYGDEVGIACPLNGTVTALVKGVENSW